MSEKLFDPAGRPTPGDAIYPVLSRENLLVGSAVVPFTPALVTPAVVYARVQVQVAQIRVTEDGTTPSPAGNVGEVYSPLDTFEVWGNAACRAFRMVRETIDARVEVTYLGA